MLPKELEKKAWEFWDRYPADTSELVMLDGIRQVQEPQLRDELLFSLCNFIVDSFVWSGWRYKNDTDFTAFDSVRALEQCVILLPKECQSYYGAVSAFFMGYHKKCLRLLENVIADGDMSAIDEEWVATNLLVFKNAFPDFWARVSEMIAKPKKGVAELIRAIERYYCSDNDDDILDAINTALQANPDSMLTKEFLSTFYFNQKRWRNAIACFECLSKTYTYTPATRWYLLALCYGKIKSSKSEIDAYNKCLEKAPSYPYARSGLAYSYYKAKQYQKSADTYKKCLDSNIELEYACTGYVMALTALGEYKKANAFLGVSPYKVRKHAVDALNEAERTSTTNACILEDHEDYQPIYREKNIPPKRSSSQFSSEKLLEDELENRLLNGSDVFGIPLKIYQRKGVYGRQMVIPVGRLDLLAEDDRGNLYIIELKKDSGYDDAYAQTVAYLDWFERSHYAKGKKVYGIICLNDPSDKLIKAIRKDKRIRLFEYQISYSEIK